jgi:DNA invertase Pin-like site-specific DNA recombinase
MQTIHAKPVVVSYLSFSRPEQAKGDSIRRQLSLSDAWCKQHKVSIDTSLSDKGISAYRGANAVTGALGTFFGLVQSGRIPRGSTLLVESLDRLSRTEILNALTQFLNLINSGISIVTLTDNREFSAATLSGPMGISDLTYSLMIMSRAHEESAIKSRRLSDAWSNKRARLAERPLTKQLPSWCEIKNNKVVVIESKAETVKTLYQWVLDGYGLTTIGKRANAELAPIGRAKYWIRSYVHKILTNRAVLGEFQPHRIRYAAGSKRREPVDNPLPHYFPAIIDEETFAAVQATLAKGRGTGGPSSGFVSIFRGLLHAPDGSRYHSMNKGASYGGHVIIPASILDGRNGAGRQVSFPLNVFEAAFFSRLNDMASLKLDDVDTDKLRRRLLATSGEIEMIDTKAAAIQQALLDAESASPSVVQVLSTLDDKKSKMQKQREAIQDELRTAELGSPADAADQIAQLLVDSYLHQLSNEKRTKLRSLICRIVRRVDCTVTRKFTITSCKVRVELATGKTYQYVVKAHRYTRSRFMIEWNGGVESLTLDEGDDRKWFDPTEIVRLRKAGKKISEIKSETGLGTSAIYRAIHRAGMSPQTIKPKVQSLRWAGHRHRRVRPKAKSGQ